MINSCSKMATKRFAIVGAGDMPIAIPLCCLMKRSPKRMRLLCMTIVIASMRAVGAMCGNSVRVFSEWRKVDNRERHWDVSMFVYMDTASYVKMRALGGRDIASRSVLSAREFLKYVACFFTMGWSWMSTHFPSAWGRLAQSEQTGRVEMGVLCSLMRR